MDLCFDNVDYSVSDRRPSRKRPPPDAELERYEQDSEPEDPHRHEEQIHSRASLMASIEDPAVPEEKKKKWHPYIPEEFDPDTLNKLEKEFIPDWRWSFLEWYTESTHKEEEDAHVGALIKFVHDNWDKVGMTSLMQQTQDWYNKKIRSKYKELARKPWPMSQIYRYFTVINPTYTIMMERQGRTLWHVANIIENHEMFEVEEESKNLRINKEALNKYFAVTKRIDFLMDRLDSSRSRKGR